MSVKAYGAYAADKPLEAITIERRAVGAHDVQIAIAFAASAIRTCIRSVPNGTARNIPAFRAMKSSAM